MRKGQVNNVNYLADTRKELRNNLTPAEAFLWTLLKSNNLKGRKFRRQHSIENYITDFYCATENLIIELDGEVHNNPIQIENDQERDTRLQELGYKVIRFENKEVFNNTDWVLSEIEACFERDN